jgi:predicted PurR-regulated permease PerM
MKKKKKVYKGLHLFSNMINTINNLFPKMIGFIKEYRRWFVFPVAILVVKIFAPSTFLILSFACFFYLIFFPLVTWLQTIVRSPRLAVAIFGIGLISLLFFVILYLIPALINQILDFTQNYPQIQKVVMTKVEAFQSNFKDFQESFMQATNVSAEGMISKYLNLWGQAMVAFFEGLIQSFGQILTRMFHVLVAFVASLYLLFGRKTILKYIKSYFDQAVSKKEKKFFLLAYQQLIGYFSGVMFLSLIGFFACWFFLSYIDLNFSLLLAIWTGIMEFIPIFGPLIAIIPIIIVAWVQAPELVGPVFIFFGILQFFLAYVIAPHVLGKKAQFQPLVVFFILLVGGELFGIWGMIFSIPLVALGVLLWKVYYNKV